MKLFIYATMFVALAVAAFGVTASTQEKKPKIYVVKTKVMPQPSFIHSGIEK